MQPARRPCAELVCGSGRPGNTARQLQHESSRRPPGMECPADDDPETSDTDDEPLFTEPTRARALDDEPLFESATTAYDGHQQPVRGGEAPPPACNEVGSGELMECWGGVDGPCGA